MSLSGLTDAHRAYLLRHLRPLGHVDLRAGGVRNKHLHRVHGLFTAQSSDTRTGAQNRRRLECRDRSPSPFSSTALGRLPPLVEPIAPVDSRTSRGELLVPPSAPDTGARPFGRFGPPQWAPRGP